jgi:hypothetical protein
MEIELQMGYLSLPKLPYSLKRHESINFPPQVAPFPNRKIKEKKNRKKKSLRRVAVQTIVKPQGWW